jgi:hypothetical protein
MIINQNFNNMIKLIRRIVTRTYVKWLKWNRSYRTDVDNKVLETEKMCMSITRSLIIHPDSKFLLAPLSGKRYIKNAEKGLFIILDRGTISLTNHVYHYDVNLTERNWERLIKMYDAKVETIRQEYEDQIMSQIKNSLHTIQDKLKSSL